MTLRGLGKAVLAGLGQRKEAIRLSGQGREGYWTTRWLASGKLVRQDMTKEFTRESSPLMNPRELATIASVIRRLHAAPIAPKWRSVVWVVAGPNELTSWLADTLAALEKTPLRVCIVHAKSSSDRTDPAPYKTVAERSGGSYTAVALNLAKVREAVARVCAKP